MNDSNNWYNVRKFTSYYSGFNKHISYRNIYQNLVDEPIQIITLNFVSFSKTFIIL